jgi:hypothetical protein
VGVSEGRGVSFGVGENPGAGVGVKLFTTGDVPTGVGVKLFTTGDVPTGVGLANFWRSLVGSALGLTAGRTVGLATVDVGTSAPVLKITNSRHPIRRRTPIP